ncbi:hypothetical protein ISS37_08515 [candidate division KSB1 bacterium]|nr:hypothetical protein [candidate division KSB1 bacterium]
MKDDRFRKIKVVLSLLDKYNKIEERLKELKIVRTRKVIPEIGEWYVSILFNYKINTNPSEKGFDCIDPKTGKKIEVKTIRKSESNPVGCWLSKDKVERQIFNELIILRLGDNFRIRQLFKLDRDDISEENFSLLSSKKYNMSWNSLKKGNFDITYENALQKGLKNIELLKMLMEQNMYELLGLRSFKRPKSS